MRTVTRVLIAAALAFGSGCAQTDWIDRTLVTVDVTGIWYGSVGGTGPAGKFRLELEQQGLTVKGLVQVTPGFGGTQVPLDGTVAGDVFRFKNSRGSLEGGLTVSGDEMTGQISWAALGRRPISLRRVDPSSRPGPPTR